MDREEVIRMADEAGVIQVNRAHKHMAPVWWSVSIEDIERFAALVAAAERERIAQLCENNCAGISYDRKNQGPCLTTFEKECGGRHDGMTYAAAIRALN